ncbi:MAG: cysteine ABC transporter ATP-binding protein, partial [Clostridium sp.]
MMINKRLINLCGESKKYIALTVLSNWIAVLCNITIVIFIGDFINKLFLKRNFINSQGFLSLMEEIKIFNKITIPLAIGIIMILLIIRFISNILYAKFSNLASSEARVTLRELIYKKL